MKERISANWAIWGLCVSVCVCACNKNAGAAGLHLDLMLFILRFFTLFMWKSLCAFSTLLICGASEWALLNIFFMPAQDWIEVKQDKEFPW